jgi:hypothetical protein
MGGDCECLCTAFAAYAHECNLRGIAIKWRSQQLCRKLTNVNLGFQVAFFVVSVVWLANRVVNHSHDCHFLSASSHLTYFVAYSLESANSHAMR